jgi:prepilin peptidase CpaA
MPVSLILRRAGGFVLHSYAWWPVLFLVAAATFTDVRTRRIPNWLNFSFLIAGSAVSTWIHGWHGLRDSIAGMALGLVIFGVLAWMGGMGMGDVKLCAAIGAWIGPGQLIFAIVVTAMVGGVMALAMAAWGGFLGELFSGSSDLLMGWKDRGMKAPQDLVLTNPKARKMPYAPAIAIGTLFSFFSH